MGFLLEAGMEPVHQRMAPFQADPPFLQSRIS
jgi:hypothetical protein